MRLRPILRQIISSPLRGIFGPTLAPDDAIISFYVNPVSGSDTNDGATASTAFATYHKALSVAAPGQKIQILERDSIVQNYNVLLPFLSAAENRRVDVIGIGDSNQLYGGTYGWDHGAQKAWVERYGAYATGVLPTKPGGAWAEAGFNYNPSGQCGVNSNDATVPAELLPYNLATGVSGAPAWGSYLAAGSTSGGAMVLALKVGSPIDMQQSTKWHSSFMKFPTSGFIWPQLRGAVGSPWGANILLDGPQITIDPAAAYEWQDISYQIPSGVVDQDGEVLLYTWQVTGGAQVRHTGPLFWLWHRLEQVDADTGVAYNTLLYQGGKSARDAAISLQAGTQTQMTEWLRQVTKLQTGSPTVLIQIRHGGNDRASSVLSVGPNPAPSNQPAGFADNIKAIHTAMTNYWVGAGYDPSNITFVVGPYQPQVGSATLGGVTKTLNEWFDSYYDAVVSLGISNMAVVYGTKITNTDLEVANSWNAVGDAQIAHMSQAGYEGFAKLELDVITNIESGVITV